MHGWLRRLQKEHAGRSPGHFVFFLLVIFNRRLLGRSQEVVPARLASLFYTDGWWRAVVHARNNLAPLRLPVCSESIGVYLLVEDG